MFSQISWSNYFEFTAFALAAYYIAVILYYNDRFRNILQLKSLQGSVRNEFIEDRSDLLPYQVKEDPASDETRFYSLIDELNAFFEQVKKSKSRKGELIQSLRAIIGKYSISDQSFYKDALTNMIRVQCENICSFQMSEQDMAMVWK